MRITVNGEQRDAPAGETLAELLKRLGVEHGACAAEVNRELVPRREHASCELREGDAVEIVTLVGGG